MEKDLPALPVSLPIVPRGPLDASPRLPGSKSITNRALVAASLARGDSELRGPLASDDTQVMLVALREMGVEIDTRNPSGWRVKGCDGELIAPAGSLDVGNSGTTARFLTAAATLADGPVVIDGSPRMRERPIVDLVQALVTLGSEVSILGKGGCPPVQIEGGTFPGGATIIDASQSSQYVSAILLAAPYADTDVVLGFARGQLVSRPYVDLTLQVMRGFGASARWSGDANIRVKAGQPYQARNFDIEPDASAAAYVFCAAAIAGGRVRVEGFPPVTIQADLGIVEILEEMGCQVERSGDGTITLVGPEDRLRGVDVDMNDLPDAVLALSVVALFAEGVTRIRNVANLRIKETDRLAALETELTKLGAKVEAGPDSLTIVPGELHGAEIDTYDDHRMAMSFALAGLRIPGVVIRDPACVSKTWPEYFSVLEHL